MDNKDITLELATTNQLVSALTKRLNARNYVILFNDEVKQKTAVISTFANSKQIAAWLRVFVEKIDAQNLDQGKPLYNG